MQLSLWKYLLYLMQTNSKVCRFTVVSKMGEMTGKNPKSPKFQEKVNGPRKSCLKNICQKCLVNLLFLKPNGCKTDSNHPLSNWILKFWKHFFTRLEINLHIPELNCKHKAKQKETKDKKLKKGECLNYDLLQVKKSTLKVTPIQKSGCR